MYLELIPFKSREIRLLKTGYLIKICSELTQIIRAQKICALYSTSPQAQRIVVERTKAGKGSFVFLSFSNHCQTQTKISSSSKTAQKNYIYIYIYIYIKT